MEQDNMTAVRSLCWMPIFLFVCIQHCTVT